MYFDYVSPPRLLAPPLLPTQFHAHVLSHPLPHPSKNSKKKIPKQNIHTKNNRQIDRRMDRQAGGQESTQINRVTDHGVHFVLANYFWAWSLPCSVGDTLRDISTIDFSFPSRYKLRTVS